MKAKLKVSGMALDLLVGQVVGADRSRSFISAGR